MNRGRPSAGLFLDFDGTLADSLGALRAVYDRFLESNGRKGSDREFEACNGLVLAEVVGVLRRDHGLESREDELLARYRGLVSETYGRVPPMPGAGALLRMAATLSLPVVVVSSAPAALVRSWVRGAGFTELISDVVGGDQGVRGKPEPDLYLLALRRTGCVPARSHAIEDSRSGAIAAVDAQLPTWVLGPAPAQRACWPDVVGFIERLDEMVEVIAGARARDGG